MTRLSRTADGVPPGEHVPTADERIVMHGVSWESFEQILASRGDRSRPRVAYLKGALELTSPSRDHEIIKKRFGEVVQAYLDAIGVIYEGAGSWLIKHAPHEAGLEPDECYLIGDLDKDRPDLAIEVTWTSGGLDKLEIYRRLGIGEVWIWKDDQIALHVLGATGYEQRATSDLLPAFDFALLREMLRLPSLSEVRKQLRDRLPHPR